MTSLVAVYGAEMLLPWVFSWNMERAIFTSVCAGTRQWFKAKHQRDVERDFLLSVSQVWAGQKASQHAWPHEPI